MAAWRDYLENEGFELLIEAKKYTEDLSQDDPEDEPYRSFYKARDNYNAVKKVLKKTADKRNADEDFQFVWAALQLKIGINFINCEEKSTGEEHLQKCLEKMEDYKLTKPGMGIYQDALNQMGILLSGRGKSDEALEYFKQAELMYVDFKNIVGGAPVMVDEYLSPPRDQDGKLEFERSTAFESAYTHTLFYFAQVYQQLGDAGISAQYVHLTLQRQLDAPNLDPLDWCLHAATLSQYYMTERQFSMSRHCLASAAVMYNQAEASDDSNTADERKEKVHQAKADITRCWIKYGLGLLEYSKEKLWNEAAEEQDRTEKSKNDDQTAQEEKQSQSETSDSEQKDVAESETPRENTTESDRDSVTKPSNENVENQASAETVSDISENQASAVNGTEEQATTDQTEAKKDAEGLEEKVTTPPKREIKTKKVEERFNLEVTSHEEKITDKPLMNFDEAREVFLKIKKWIEEAKHFYKLELHCLDYVAIVQDHSLSFKFLSFFELDLERQCKMHKRRVDMLTEVLNELNPQHYLLVCRQLMFEIADTYSAMMDLKMAILEAAGEGVRPTPHHVKKINALVKESIQYYQNYLDTLKGGKPVYPNEFPVNDVRPGLIAMFCMGRLYSKYVASDVQTRLLNIKKTKDCYQFVVDYCKRNPSAKDLISTELDICQEMVELLPAKMERIRQQSEI